MVRGLGEAEVAGGGATGGVAGGGEVAGGGVVGIDGFGCCVAGGGAALIVGGLAVPGIDAGPLPGAESFGGASAGARTGGGCTGTGGLGLGGFLAKLRRLLRTTGLSSPSRFILYGC